MRSFAVVAALMGAAMSAPSTLVENRAANKQFTIARSGTIDDLVITKENTLNGTFTGTKSQLMSASKFQIESANPGSLPLEFINNFDGSQVKAYISGLDSDGKVAFIKADGSVIYPSSNGAPVGQVVEINNDDIAIPLGAKGSTFTMTLPITLSSGRIYFCEGTLPFFMTTTGDNGAQGLVQPAVTNIQDPSAGLNWGFVELTYTHDTKALYANVSYVDFIGMLLSMSLSVTDGGAQQVTKGLEGGAVQKVCDELVQQKNKDGRAWDKMCIANSAGQPLRVLNPTDYYEINSGDFEDYWNDYINQVWEKYASQPLTIDTQNEGGKVQCHTNGDVINCDGDPKPYAKPTAKAVWGCDDGPFHKDGDENAIRLAIIPRLCAAINRSTLLLDGGDVQPALDATHYYTVDPSNHYSRIVHEHEVDGRGYAFSYDDVNPNNDDNASGVVSSGAPGTLTVTFGAPL